MDHNINPSLLVGEADHLPRRALWAPGVIDRSCLSIILIYLDPTSPTSGLVPSSRPQTRPASVPARRPETLPRWLRHRRQGLPDEPPRWLRFGAGALSNHNSISGSSSPGRSGLLKLDQLTNRRSQHPVERHLVAMDVFAESERSMPTFIGVAVTRSPDHGRPRVVGQFFDLGSQ